MELVDRIEKSEEGLEQLITAALMFEENHYLEAIKQKKLSEYDILQLTEDVRLWHSKMRKESLKLSLFSEHFLDEFATDNNNRFHDAYALFNKVRSNINGSRKMFRKFCRRIMKNPTNENASNSVIDRSILSAHVVSRDIFGLKSYSENVEILYNEMKGFFTTLVLTLALCHRMIREEATIMKDAERCLEIYKKCREDILSSARIFARTFNIKTEKVSESELLEHRKNAKSMKEYAHKHYHHINKAENLTVVAYEIVCDSDRNGLSKIEELLWQGDVEMVKKVREVIAIFDKLVVGKKKISGLLMLEFIKWCHVKERHEHKLYEYFLENYQGNIPPVGWTQIFNTRKGLNITDEKLAEGFQKELDILKKEAA